jgi:two-component system OmpR family response regulator
LNILLVEDDRETADFVTRGLTEMGHTVTAVRTGADALVNAASGVCDVIVFDRMLPDMDGTDAVRVLRKSGADVPIIMLTALASIDDRVAGLEAGADDYLVKPFAFAELYARIKALARRQPLSEPETTLCIADLSMDRTTQTVKRGEDTLELLPREYRILEYLMLHEGQLVTRTMLLEKIWGYSFDPKTSLVHTHVSRLRAKVDKPYDTELIHTVRGSGYILGSPREGSG